MLLILGCLDIPPFRGVTLGNLSSRRSQRPGSWGCPRRPCTLWEEPAGRRGPGAARCLGDAPSGQFQPSGVQPRAAELRPPSQPGPGTPCLSDFQVSQTRPPAIPRSYCARGPVASCHRPASSRAQAGSRGFRRAQMFFFLFCPKCLQQWNVKLPRAPAPAT